jgi:fatty-acyl-CoA synthase
MTNRIEYLAAWIGFSKVGIATALINTNLTGQALAHCLNIVNVAQVVADEGTWKQVEDARALSGRTLMLWVVGLKPEDEADARRNLDNAGAQRLLGAAAEDGPRRPDQPRHRPVHLHLRHHRHAQGGAHPPFARPHLYARLRRLHELDAPGRHLDVLPLYHSTGGLVGVGPALLNGGRLILRKRFSATNFWPDVKASGATMFVYIGELCRYLVNCPERGRPRAQAAAGLRQRPAARRLARIPEAGSPFRTSSNSTARPRATSPCSISTANRAPSAACPNFLKKQINIRLVRFDIDTKEPVRGPNGLCEEARPGEIGEAIGAIGNDVRHDFSGYADKAASEKKILTDVFARGDRWFRTGDLMKSGQRGLSLFHRPDRRHLPLEGRERLDLRGRAAAGRRAGRQGSHRLWRAGAPPRARPGWSP